MAGKRASKTDSTRRVVTADGLANVRSGLGIDGRDNRIASTYALRGRMPQAHLDALWQQSWVCAEVVETVPEHCARAWLDVTVADDDDGEIAKALQAHVDRFKCKIKDAHTWARLYGGALLLLGIDDGQDPSEPVNAAAVKGITFAHVVDRWEAQPETWETDIASPRFAEPRTYRVTFASGAASPQLGWHADRVIRFNGNPLPRLQKRANNGWDDSVLERVFDRVRDHDHALDGAASAAGEFALSVLAIEGLAQDLVMDGTTAGSALQTRLREFLLQLRSAGLAVIDKGEAFSRLGHQVSGLAEILDRLWEQVAGAAGIPRAILSGQAAGTTRAGADTDVRAFYDRIGDVLSDLYVPEVRRIAWYEARALGLDLSPDAIEVKPRSLWQTDDKTDAEIGKLKAEAAQIATSIGALGPTEVRPGLLAALGAVADPEFETAMGQDAEPAPDLDEPAADEPATDPAG